eukprot:TRINITY_DN3515_c0_g1_i3.p1 TRINITY_DN3515_c0_g1~~TRINITY_DN3515_c0_g1_i3.p1  ORF type:complete len:663 (+),score=94.56 TRINITY_DN3515_c0_g1_i3:146-2134(+)
MAWEHQAVASVSLAAAVGCLVVYALHLCLQLAICTAGGTSSWTASGTLRSACMRFFGGASSLKGSGGENDLLAGKAHEIAVQRSSCYWLFMCRLAFHVFALWLLCDMLVGRFDELLDVARGGHRSDFRYATCITGRVVPCMLSLYFILVPEHSTPTARQVLQAVLACYIVSQVVRAESIEALKNKEAMHAMASQSAALLAGSPILTTTLATLTCAARVGIYMMLLGEANDEELQRYASLLGEEHAVSYVFEHIAVSMACVFMASVLEHTLLEGALASLREQASYQVQKTVKSLLAVLCDAVVCTDENFVLTEPCFALANTLLRQTPGKSYEGDSFLDFLEESDRVRVQGHFAEASVGIAQSIISRMVDGNGAVLKMQLYCVPYDIHRVVQHDCLEPVCVWLEVFATKAINHNRSFEALQRYSSPSAIKLSDLVTPAIHGKRRHIIGVKEGDGSSPNDTMPLQPSRVLFEAYRSRRWRPRYGSAEASTAGSDSTTTSATSSVESKEDAEAYIRLSSMEVVTWNAAFTMLCGPEQEQGFLFTDWLVSRQAERFPRVVRRICEKFMNKQSDPEDPTMIRLGTVTLQPPQAKLADLKYNVEVHLDMESLRGQSRSNGNACLRVKLCDLTNIVKPKRPRSPRSPSAGETPSCSSSEGQDDENPLVAL